MSTKIAHDDDLQENRFSLNLYPTKCPISCQIDSNIKTVIDSSWYLAIKRKVMAHIISGKVSIIGFHRSNEVN